MFRHASHELMLTVRLEPSESPNTDVILLGHSMGGLLAAEVVLSPPSSPRQALRHRIVGTVNFDTPFLGMHPGVIASGLGSLFRRSPSPPARAVSPPNRVQGQDYFASSSTSLNSSLSPSTSRTDTLSSVQPDDPNYNPVFPNDIVLPVRKGWNSALHFMVKHSDNLTKATKQYVKSHVEFGGAMADYPGLRARYARIRALEEEDERARRTATNGSVTPPRVRFVNYYTASTGRPKRPKSPSKSPDDGHVAMDSSVGAEMQDTSLIASTSRESRSSVASPRISIEEHRDDEIIRKSLDDELDSHSDQDDMEHVDPMPIHEPHTPPSDDHAGTDTESFRTPPETPSQASPTTSTQPAPEPLAQASILPPIPPPPTGPTPPDLSSYSSKDARKLAEKDHARALKTYQRALKDHTNALRDRAKLEEKLARTARKDAAAQLKAVEKQRRAESKAEAEQKAQQQREQQEQEQQQQQQRDAATSRPTNDDPRLPQPPPPPQQQHQQRQASQHHPPSSTSSSSPSSSALHPAPSPVPPKKPARDRKFCVLPSPPDPAWVRVHMEGVDEVGAHCGLFFASPAYERLVGDVAVRVEDWLRLEADRRLARALGALVAEECD